MNAIEPDCCRCWQRLKACFAPPKPGGPTRSSPVKKAKQPARKRIVFLEMP